MFVFPHVPMSTKRKDPVKPVYEVDDFGIHVPIYANALPKGGVLYKVSPYKPYTYQGEQQKGKSYTLNEIPLLIKNLNAAYLKGKALEAANATETAGEPADEEE